MNAPLLRRLSLACAALAALVGLCGPSRAAATDDLIPPAGVIEVFNNPCLLAKYGQGKPCAEPTLPDSGETRALVAAHLARARFFIAMYELKKALAEADAALALDPDDVSVRHLVARLALSTGDHPRAGREIAAALRQSPDDPDLHATNAVRLEILSARGEALRELDDVLTGHPDHAFSRETRAKLLLTMGRPKDAAADLDVLLADEHPQPVLWSLRGAADMALDDPRRAVADFTKAMEGQTALLVPLTARATAYALAGDDAGALRDLDAILGPIGGRPNYAIAGDQLAKYRTQRAQVLERLGRFPDAANEMSDALNAGGRRAILRAQVFLRQNGFPEVALDGHDSDGLRSALQVCFGQKSCFVSLSGTL
jgi:tetratricopeptide (TPR) repeat protein